MMESERALEGCSMVPLSSTQNSQDFRRLLNLLSKVVAAMSPKSRIKGARGDHTHTHAYEQGCWLRPGTCKP